MTETAMQRVSRATVFNDEGELEVRLSPGGNWQLYLRARDDLDWRLACSGGLDGESQAPPRLLDPEPVCIGPLTVDFAGHSAQIAGREVSLTRREYSLLALLATKPGRVFTKAEIMCHAFDYERSIESRLVDSHASRLRVKLRRAGAGELLRNRWGIGYRLWSDAPLALAASKRVAA
jgi:DNA-binding winged helix-turn-helix (wHTH) protein